MCFIIVHVRQRTVIRSKTRALIIIKEYTFYKLNTIFIAYG
jgi:hypothetical protein